MASLNIKHCIVLFLLHIFIFSATALTSHINGGGFADEEEAPFIAAIVNRDSNYYVCGSSILSKRTIVASAMNCLQNLQNAAILAGSLYLNSPDMKKYNIDRVLIHPQYMGMLNNLGLAFLEQDIEFSNTIKPIPLETDTISGGVLMTFYGWGEDHTAGPNMNALKKLDVITMSQEACIRYHNSSFLVSPHHLCTESYRGGEACKKDTEGPFVNDGKLVSVFSYAFGLCGQPVPHTSARMSYFADWINENLI